MYLIFMSDFVNNTSLIDLAGKMLSCPQASSALGGLSTRDKKNVLESKVSVYFERAKWKKLNKNKTKNNSP